MSPEYLQTVCSSECIQKVCRTQELLEIIFSCLNPSAVKNASLVSRLWRSVIGKPKFWTWSKIKLENCEMEVIQSRIIQLVSQVDICIFGHKTAELSEKLLRRIIDRDICQLKTLKFEEFSILFSTSVDRDLLAEAITKVETVRIKGMSSETGRSIFSAVASSLNMTLRSLSLNTGSTLCYDDTAGKAIVKLEEVSLCATSLIPSQYESIFESIITCNDLKLKALHISHDNLSGVTTSSLVTAMSRLKAVTLCDTGLVPAQITEMFKLVAKGNCSLRKLHLREIHLSTVQPELITQATSRLQVLKLEPTKSKYIEPCRVT